MAKRKANDDGGQEKRRQPYALAPQIETHVFFLFVGDPFQLITIHSNLLPPATTGYIHSRFHKQGFCYLPEEDAEIVNLWRLFLYNGKIYSNDEAADQDAPDDGEESHADGEWTKLAHAYFFGKIVKDEAFCNSCVMALVDKVKDTGRFPTGIAREVYAYTERGDRLRKLIVALHVYIGEGTCVKAPHEDANGPKRFHRHVRRGLLFAPTRAEDRKSLWADPCAFHEHRTTERCGT